ncbi:MAG: hypothetical protein ACJAT5_000156 [Lentimonas sp.]|jgi:hypothetical protein
MSNMQKAEVDDSVSMENLSARWDTIAFRAQDSPFEELSISALAKNSGVRRWARPGSVKGDVLARYIYFSFEELLEVEKLDLKSAILLLEICETTFSFEKECEDLGSFEEIDSKAYAQRMRFVEEFGIYQDYPVSLSHLDESLLELCEAENIVTFIELMEFLDRLSEKAWIGGVYKNLQNVFAHGDEKGLVRYFPYRLGHRGFHLPEAVSFCLKRLSKNELKSVHEYFEYRSRRHRLIGKRVELPKIIELKLLTEIFECLHYFGCRQSYLLAFIRNPDYRRRELMFLNQPEVESLLNWLIHLALGFFRSSQTFDDVTDEVEAISINLSADMCENLRKMINEEVSR